LEGLFHIPPKHLYDFYVLDAFVYHDEAYQEALKDAAFKDLKNDLVNLLDLFINECSSTLTSVLIDEIIAIKTNSYDDWDMQQYMYYFDNSLLNSSLYRMLHCFPELKKAYLDTAKRLIKKIKTKPYDYDLLQIAKVITSEVNNFNTQQVDTFLRESVQYEKELEVYAGKAWLDIWEQYLRCLDSNDSRTFMVNFDHMIDLTHNTGSILTKFDKETVEAINNKRYYGLNDYMKVVSRDIKKVLQDYLR